MWLYIDYLNLNKVTIKNKYLLPRINDLLDQLKQATVFSMIDLWPGYHHIQVKSSNTLKTAFKIWHGLYEFLVISFGMTNVPVVFVDYMNRVFQLYVHQYFVIFKDDILIYSRNLRARITF